MILEDINPDVEIEVFDLNISSLDSFDFFMDQLKHGGKKPESPVDLVLCCVDNFDARFSINQACLELDLTWMESGVAEDSMSSHIQLLIPGLLACFECAPPLISASGIPESTLKREGVCSASLPTTMTITSALLVQNTLKYLLKFGKVSFHQGYIALRDYFPSQSMRPNEFCSNDWCIKRQKEKDTSFHALEEMLDFIPKEEVVEIIHTENPYNIVLESSSEYDEVEKAKAKPENVNPQKDANLEFALSSSVNEDDKEVNVNSSKDTHKSPKTNKENIKLLQDRLRSLQK